MGKQYRLPARQKAGAYIVIIGLHNRLSPWTRLEVEARLEHERLRPFCNTLWLELGAARFLKRGHIRAMRRHDAVQAASSRQKRLPRC